MKKLYLLLFFLATTSSSCSYVNQSEFINYLNKYYKEEFSNIQYDLGYVWANKERGISFRVIMYSRLEYIYNKLKNPKWNENDFEVVFNGALKKFEKDHLKRLVNELNNIFLSDFIQKSPKYLYMDIADLKVFFEGCEIN